MLEAARTISHDETAELYDGYLNDFYRSLKAWRTGNELAGRIECGRSLRFLGELLFALDGVRAPYPKEWPGKLGELEPLILEVARTGEPRLQQELCATSVNERRNAAIRTFTTTGPETSIGCSDSRSPTRASRACSSHSDLSSAYSTSPSSSPGIG